MPFSLIEQLAATVNRIRRPGERMLQHHMRVLSQRRLDFQAIGPALAGP